MSHRPATPRAMEFPADVEMEMDDSHLPKSSSSAMPDLQAATVPRLKAKVHRLTPDRLKQISLSDWIREASEKLFRGVVVSLFGCCCFCFRLFSRRFFQFGYF